MISFEELKKYLPKYLSPEEDQKLFEELQQFPENIDTRIYSPGCKAKDIIYQGDGLIGMPFVSLPSREMHNVSVMVISNSCDNNPDNSRYFESSLCYCPVQRLQKYRTILLENGVPARAVDDHVATIKRQRIAQILYLPSLPNYLDESIVFLNKIVHCRSSFVPREGVNTRKIFSLSDYGYYLFVFKLSILMNRINEGTGRASSDWS